MSEQILVRVQQLGKQYDEIKASLTDLKFLTTPGYALDLLSKIEFIRSEMVAIGAAYRLDDNSIIIRSEFIIGFLEPAFPAFQWSKRETPDLKNQKVIEKIALTCGLSQWLFLANQLPDHEDREEFLKACARIVGEQAKKKR